MKSFLFCIFFLLLAGCTAKSRQTDSRPKHDHLYFADYSVGHNSERAFLFNMIKLNYDIKMWGNRWSIYDGTCQGFKSRIMKEKMPVHGNDTTQMRETVVFFVMADTREELIPLFKQIREKVKQEHKDYAFHQGVENTGKPSVPSDFIVENPTYRFRLDKGTHVIEGALRHQTFWLNEKIKVVDGCCISIMYQADYIQPEDRYW